MSPFSSAADRPSLHPEASVVIPTFNRPELVVRAVHSVLRQTVRASEVIVVVDGGDPATCERLQQIDDERLVVVPAPARSGPGPARNIGVSQARAQWVAFLDDDDEMVPERLAVQLAAARNSPHPYPVVASRYLVLTPDGGHVYPQRLPEPGEALSDYLFHRRGLFGRTGAIGTSSLLVRAELLRRLPIPDLPRHEDWAWVLTARIYEGVHIQVLPAQLTVCHEDPSVPSITRPTGRQNEWSFSYRWAHRYRKTMTRRAYASFLLGTVARMARDDDDRGAARRLLVDAFREGDPRLTHLALFAAIWLLPKGMRDSALSYVRRSASGSEIAKSSI